MKTMEFVQKADTDKFVRVAVPVEDAERQYRVIVSVEAEATHPLEEWPAGFIDRTFGGWKGELERAPQGEYEERKPF